MQEDGEKLSGKSRIFVSTIYAEKVVKDNVILFLHQSSKVPKLLKKCYKQESI